MTKRQPIVLVVGAVKRRVRVRVRGRSREKRVWMQLRIAYVTLRILTGPIVASPGIAAKALDCGLTRESLYSRHTGMGSPNP